MHLRACDGLGAAAFARACNMLPGIMRSDMLDDNRILEGAPACSPFERFREFSPRSYWRFAAWRPPE
jgi:hypothetical protein